MACEAVYIARGQASGKYDDILDVAGELASGDYASASNAIAVMCRQGRLFRDTIKAIRARRGNGRAVSKAADADT